MQRLVVLAVRPGVTRRRGHAAKGEREVLRVRKRRFVEDKGQALRELTGSRNLLMKDRREARSVTEPSWSVTAIPVWMKLTRPSVVWIMTNEGRQVRVFFGRLKSIAHRLPDPVSDRARRIQ